MQITQSPMLFVGYESLEEWARVIQKQQPVYAMLTHEPGRVDENGMHIDTLVIHVSQPDPEQMLVHYCRMPVGQITYIRHQPFDPDHKQRSARAEDAFDAVQAWLEEHEFSVIPGMIAMPQGYRYLEGWAGFIKWDPVKDTYVRS